MYVCRVVSLWVVVVQVKTNAQQCEDKYFAASEICISHSATLQFDFAASDLQFKWLVVPHRNVFSLYITL